MLTRAVNRLSKCDMGGGSRKDCNSGQAVSRGFVAGFLGMCDRLGPNYSYNQ